MIWLFVTMGSIADVYLAARQKQTGPLALHERLEAGCCDGDRANRAVRAGGKVQRVQPLDKTVPYPRCSDHVERAMLRIDDRCSDNPHIPIYVCAAVLPIVE